MTSRCPACGAPRLPMAFCPECRRPYEPEAPAPPPAGAVWTGAADEARLERRLRLWAPPAVLGVALLAMQSDTLRAAARLFSGMWLHELGHATGAWLSGFVAFPGPWRTSIGETRSWPFALFVAAGLAVGVWQAWIHGRRKLAYGLGAVLALQAILTLALRPARAQALILFAGDGGGMILGALLCATFFTPPGGALARTWLRWGFLVLGAFGFMDPFTTWWRARHDLSAIPFGEIAGVGHSDPTRLVDDHGWTMGALVTRFVATGCACLVALAVVAILDARRRGQEATGS